MKQWLRKRCGARNERRSAPRAEMVIATAERTATVAIVPMTRSADGTAMMRAMSAATGTTDGHLLVGTDPDLLLRAIDTAGTGVSVSVSAMTMSAVVTTVIGGVMIPDLVGMTGIVAETVATIKTRQTRTLDTRTAMTDVIGAVKVTAHHVDTLDPLARLETAMNILLPPRTVAETSPAVSSITGGTLAGIIVHLLLVPQPTSLILRRLRKNDAVSWQRCNPMPLIWR
jgi:hypothetical protein